MSTKYNDKRDSFFEKCFKSDIDPLSQVALDYANVGVTQISRGELQSALFCKTVSRNLLWLVIESSHYYVLFNAGRGNGCRLDSTTLTIYDSTTGFN